MHIDTKKIELIDWIAGLNNKQVINEVLKLKQVLSSPKTKKHSKIFGSGKHLVDYIADDFNEPKYLSKDQLL